MLIVDDILTSPIKGLFWLFKEIHQAAEEEQAGEAERLTAQLSELYMQLETGQITEAEFDAREKEYLDRLDEIQARETLKAAPTPAKVKKKKAPGKKTKTARPRRGRGVAPPLANP